MLAEEVEIDLRIHVMQVHYAVKRRVQMRVVDSCPAFISFGCIRAVQVQIRVGVAVIGEFPYVRFHVTAHLTVIYFSFGGDL